MPLDLAVRKPTLVIPMSTEMVMMTTHRQIYNNNIQYRTCKWSLWPGFKMFNLESLGIGATHFLAGDLLDWKPTYQGLKDIYLHRVKLSTGKLIRLLSPTEDLSEESPVLSKLWLEEVDLKNGPWNDVFQYLCDCPQLSYFSPENLGYARGGRVFSSQILGWRGDGGLE